VKWRIFTLALTGVLAVALGAASAHAWLAEDDAGSPSADVVANEQVAAGAQLFQVKGCAACHAVASDDIVGGFSTGPDLSRLPGEAGTRVERMSAEEYVRVSIAAPDAFIVPGYNFSISGSGSAMPALPLTPAEIDALTAFLLTQEPDAD
jgi:mono/diheme cytochrome c family protein